MKIFKIVRFRIREKHVVNSLIDDDLSQIMPPIQTSNTRNSEILPMNEEAAMKALIQPKWFIVLLSPFHLLWDDILGWYLRDYFFLMITIHDLRTLEVEHDLETYHTKDLDLSMFWPCEHVKKILFKTIVLKYCPQSIIAEEMKRTLLLATICLRTKNTLCTSWFPYI